MKIIDKKSGDSPEFRKLLLNSQTKIFASIWRMVRSYYYTNNLMDEVIQTMRQEYSEGMSMDDFVAWANQIAYSKIMSLNIQKKISPQFRE